MTCLADGRNELVAADWRRGTLTRIQPGTKHCAEVDGFASSGYLATVASDGTDQKALPDVLDWIAEISKSLAVPSLCSESPRQPLRSHL